MPLLSISHVTHHYGGPTLLDDVTLAVEPGARIGLLGRNGTGKTTLLRILGGQLEPTAGEAHRQRGVRVASQAQELVCPPGVTVIDEMRRAFVAETERERRLRDLEERLGAEADEAGRAKLLAEYERLQGAHEAERGWDVERRIATVLSSLGLAEETWTRPLATFSGGERNVIGLARVLLSEPDVMLLDEPSNHLDMDGIDWFCEFVRQSRAALVMVSHNRHLLDEVADEIWELEGSKVSCWTGNYTAFRRQKDEALALRERQWEVQQRLIRRLEFQARRLKDMANAYDDPGQARRARSMLKRIERIDAVEKPKTDDRRFRARFDAADRHGRIALSVRGFTCAMGDRTLFDGAELEIEQGERVCLVGPNGSGKTTLFRRILDEGSWENPVLRLGRSVRVGEYRQIHEAALDPEETVIDGTCAATRLTIPDAEALLHRFLFRREDLERRVATLSGGEKSRLQLARLVAARVNFLFLDEPTNHLDVEGCEQLEEMLEEFDGTLFVISHDRYFLDRLVTRVVEVADRRLVSHPTSFAEWWRARREARRRRSALERRDVPSDPAEAEAARRQHDERKARSREAQRMRQRLASLEQRISTLEARQAEISARLEAAYGGAVPREEAAALAGEFATVKEEVQRLYAEWEGLAAGIEDAP